MKVVADDLNQQLAAAALPASAGQSTLWEISPEQIDQVSGGLPPFHQGNIFFDCPGSSFGQNIGMTGGPMFNQGTPPTPPVEHPKIE